MLAMAWQSDLSLRWLGKKEMFVQYNGYKNA